MKDEKKNKDFPESLSFYVEKHTNRTKHNFQYHSTISIYRAAANSSPHHHLISPANTKFHIKKYFLEKNVIIIFGVKKKKK